MGAWDLEESGGGGGGSGTVTSVSVNTANGYSGTVTSPTTTPAITISGPAALPPNGAAGGVLSGTYPNPGIATSLALTGTPTAPTAAQATSSTQIATTAFVQTALKYVNILTTVTLDPNPAQIGGYYRLNYASNGNFTLPSSPGTGAVIQYKVISSGVTYTIIGTVDGVVNPTVTTQYQAGTLVYNGTTWDNI